MTVTDGKVSVESVSAGGGPQVNSATVEPLSEPLFVRLQKLQCLRKLSLNYGNGEALSRATLRSIGALQNLRELELYGSAIKDEVMVYVCSLTNLESLRIWEVSIGEPGIAQLLGLKSLKSLHLYTRETVNERSMGVIMTLPKLEYLRIAGDIRDGAFSAVRMAPRLETVAVGGPRGAMALAELHDAPTVRRVEIMRAEVDAATAEHLRGITNLSSVRLECCAVSPEAARVLSSLNLHQIECVELRNDVLGDLAKGMRQGYGSLNVRH